MWAPAKDLECKDVAKARDQIRKRLQEKTEKAYFGTISHWGTTATMTVDQGEMLRCETLAQISDRFWRRMDQFCETRKTHQPCAVHKDMTYVSRMFCNAQEDTCPCITSFGLNIHEYDSAALCQGCGNFINFGNSNRAPACLWFSAKTGEVYHLLRNLQEKKMDVIIDAEGMRLVNLCKRCTGILYALNQQWHGGPELVKCELHILPTDIANIAWNYLYSNVCLVCRPYFFY